MATFRYQGRDLEGQKVSGLVDAATQELAAESLMAKGIIPISIKAGKENSESSFEWKSLLTPAVPLEVYVIFCRQMYSLTKAGIPLLRAIRSLIADASNKQLKQALQEVANELTNGRSLSASMQLHSSVFSPLFVSMIAVGENTGRLDQALLQLSHYYEQELETRKRIKTAMRYPVLVISFITVAMFVLNLKVIPQFASMFNRFQVELPLPTRILIGTSNFFVEYWTLLLAVMVGCLFAFQAWVSRADGREQWDKIRLRIPVVGDIVNRAQLARFSRTFSLMLQSGVPLNNSLALSAEAMDNKYLEARLLEMKSAIEAAHLCLARRGTQGSLLPWCNR
ncbi:MSHA biogenesis protein mshG [Vibrio ishigakensis]|uniref:MSHA biogenesis protein mshG n=1 Tax=Vibrio ishigakensis TaxID=1481914 RepID=A0A0B8QK43_9VIBR|nr:MSHA biogenesis protein mshG [Vibrio ishigakensis]